MPKKITHSWKGYYLYLDSGLTPKPPLKFRASHPGITGQGLFPGWPKFWTGLL